MNKKNKIHRRMVASEFVIGIILLLAIIIGGISWLGKMKERRNEQETNYFQSLAINNRPIVKNNVIKPANNQAACTPKYYDGEGKINVWLSGLNNSDSKELMLEVASADAKKMPIGNTISASSRGSFAVKLIDPTDGVKAQIEKASKENPTEIVIKGYADICEQFPIISVESVSKAFKK